MKWLNFLNTWLEVWALLIPTAIILIYRPTGKAVWLLLTYVFAALLLNSLCLSMVEYYYLMPSWTYTDGSPNNNILYNIHSFLRVTLLGWFIISVRNYRYTIFLKGLLLTYLIFVVINFSIFESLLFLSTRLFAAESIVLLIISLSYFIRSILDETEINWLKHPSFIICSGICLYEAITFFIFLFFYPLVNKDPTFFAVTMKIYSITYLVLCILFAFGFYQYSPLKKLWTARK